MTRKNIQRYYTLKRLIRYIYTTCSKQKSTLRTSSGHSFSTVNILFDRTGKAIANTIFPPFSKETGKLKNNRNGMKNNRWRHFGRD